MLRSDWVDKCVFPIHANFTKLLLQWIRPRYQMRIMHRKNVIPLILLGLVANSSALDEAGKKAGDELISSYKEDLKVLAESESDGNNGYALKQTIRQFQTALTSGNNRQLLQAIDNTSNKNTSEKTQRCLIALRNALSAEQKQKTEDLIVRLEDFFKKTREKVLAAKSPADLDAVLEEIPKREYSNNEESDGDVATASRLRQLFEQVSSTKQFVTNWQDYLQAKASGNTSKAIQSIQSLSQQENPLIPRSQIIALLEQERSSPQDANKILDDIKTLDQMGDALKQLTNIQQTYRYSDSGSSQLTELTQTLARMEKCYRDFTAGLPVNLEVFNPNTDSSSTMGKISFTRLKADLLILVLPRYLGIPEAANANDNETVDQFIARITTEAKARGDTAACQRIREAQELLGRSSRFSNDDTAALHNYAAGQNQFAAHQYMLAVVSYQTALKSGSDLLPVEKIGAQLELIQKEHPEEYKQGMTEFLTPKPTMPDFGRQMRGYDPRMMRAMGDNPNMPPSGPSVLLPVPAKEAPAPPKAGEKPQEAPSKAHRGKPDTN